MSRHARVGIIRDFDDFGNMRYDLIWPFPVHPPQMPVPVYLSHRLAPDSLHREVAGNPVKGPVDPTQYVPCSVENCRLEGTVRSRYLPDHSLAHALRLLSLISTDSGDNGQAGRCACGI